MTREGILHIFKKCKIYRRARLNRVDDLIASSFHGLRQSLFQAGSHIAQFPVRSSRFVREERAIGMKTKLTGFRIDVSLSEVALQGVAVLVAAEMIG